jgi:hypothetical protein
VTAGLSATMAASRLNVYRGTAQPAVAVNVKLHIGDPGAAGTANASAVTTRNAATWNAPSAGAMTLASLTAWAMTASETVSHLSLWDAATGGNFLESLALTSPVPVISGSSLTVGTLTISEAPLAA